MIELDGKKYYNLRIDELGFAGRDGALEFSDADKFSEENQEWEPLGKGRARDPETGFVCYSDDRDGIQAVVEDFQLPWNHWIGCPFEHNDEIIKREYNQAITTSKSLHQFLEYLYDLYVISDFELDPEADDYLSPDRQHVVSREMQEELATMYSDFHGKCWYIPFYFLEDGNKDFLERLRERVFKVNGNTDFIEQIRRDPEYEAWESFQHQKRSFLDEESKVRTKVRDDEIQIYFPDLFPELEGTSIDWLLIDDIATKRHWEDWQWKMYDMGVCPMR